MKLDSAKIANYSNNNPSAAINTVPKLVAFALGSAILLAGGAMLAVSVLAVI